MAHKKQRPLPNTHPRQRILNELKNKEKSIEFPDYNPTPKRKTEMKKSEKKVYYDLKYREWLRTHPKAKPFVGWEYGDRYAHRKSTRK